MKKTRLVSYEVYKYHSLNDSCTNFTLRLRTEWLFGLFVTTKSIKYPVTRGVCIDELKSHWDGLISTKKVIKS